MTEIYFNAKFSQFLNKQDADTIFDIAKNFLEVENVKQILNELDEEAKEEIMENFNFSSNED